MYLLSRGGISVSLAGTTTFLQTQPRHIRIMNGSVLVPKTNMYKMAHRVA